MCAYLKIPNLYKEDDVLLFKECFCLEKIDGTSAHISWNKGQLNFFSGGAKHESFVELFDKEALITALTNNFGIEGKVTIYGEAYGGKMQGMSGTYGKELRFIAFDVRVGEHCWLSVPQAFDVVRKLGLEFVHYKKVPTTIEAIDAEREADSVQAVRNGIGEGKRREGIVLHPLIEVRKNNGERIIAKHKNKEFRERRVVPKVGEKVKVLEEAKAIAYEWVTPQRLQHILQKLPSATGIEHTGDVIKAMIADVFEEAKGEVIESKEAKAAIGSKTAVLWKQHLKSAKGLE